MSDLKNTIEEKETPTICLKNVSMTFGLNKALDEVNLEIMPGEIHGLLGQNGCGKSTLIKVLSGFNNPDKGSEVYINSEKVKLPIDPNDISKYGLNFVHQDLGLTPTLSVLENFRNEQLFKSGLKIDWKNERKKAREVLDKYNINVSLDANIESLSQVDKALLSIVRAVESITSKGKNRGLLVLDEPTVFLTKTEVDTLFELVREVASTGISVLFVSHDLDEVMQITDVITVLRDGKNCGSAITKETTKDHVIEMILGQKLSAFVKDKEEYKYTEHPDQIIFDKIRGNTIQEASFTANPGEVVGVTGLVGSGFDELPYVIFGANDFKSGTMTFKGDEINLQEFNTRKAVEKKIALIPADRANKGIIGDLKIEENVMMQVHERFNIWNLDKKKMRTKAADLNQKYEVYPNDISMNLGQLSGGNQQKVVLAKWLQERPELLILHEPTQGVDIGARQQIYKHIDKVVRHGTTVICASSDYEQLVQICDRVIVFVRGRIVEILTGNEISKERITRLCYNSI